MSEDYRKVGRDILDHYGKTRMNHTIKNTDIVIDPSAPVVRSAESGLEEIDNVESDSITNSSPCCHLHPLLQSVGMMSYKRSRRWSVPAPTARSCWTLVVGVRLPWSLCNSVCVNLWRM
jgi:hypothetical protein